MNTKKHMILLTRKATFGRESLVEFWAKLQTKTETGWNKNQEVLQAWSNRGSYLFIFLQNKNRLHSATVVQFPFSQPSRKSFCRNAGLCWGSWPCLPLIFLGWLVVGVWTKMIGRLEGTFPELFLSICSSKLEASQAFLQRLHLFLKMDVTTSTIFIFCVFRSKSSVVDSWGTYFSSWCMHDKCMTCNLYDKLALRGVTYDRNSCIMKQESWFLPKLYNKNFMSDGHCVTHKS